MWNSWTIREFSKSDILKHRIGRYLASSHSSITKYYASNACQFNCKLNKILSCCCFRRFWCIWSRAFTKWSWWSIIMKTWKNCLVSREILTFRRRNSRGMRWEEWVFRVNPPPPPTFWLEHRGFIGVVGCKRILVSHQLPAFSCLFNCTFEHRDSFFFLSFSLRKSICG